MASEICPSAISPSVQVPFSTHFNGFWQPKSHYQHRHLLVESEYQNGKQTLTVVELPDCSKVKAIQVVVPRPGVGGEGRSSLKPDRMVMRDSPVASARPS